MEDKRLKNEAYRQADLRTLKGLWSYITPQLINHIVEYVGTTDLEAVFLTYSLHRYEDLRRNRPDLHFINENLEAAFVQFDADLAKFTRFLGNKATAEFFNGKYVYISEYHESTKAHPEYNAIMGIDQEQIQEFLRVHHEIEARAIEMQNAYGQLIHKIKRLLPEFDFPEDTQAFKEMEKSRLQFAESISHLREDGTVQMPAAGDIPAPPEV